jgi:hypothetical protein
VGAKGEEARDAGTLFRAEDNGGACIQIATGLTRNAWTDRGVTRGKTYLYAVTATDRSGN